MSAGSQKDYKFGSKNHWRRTVWNEVLRRTAGKEHSQHVLYLAGRNDLDRAVAVSKGVPAENLVAIDIEQANVAAARAGGTVAVKGDIIDVLWTWPKDRKVAAVLLDYCCGLEWWNTGAYDAFEREPLREATIVVNFQRGRDAFWNDKREALRRAGLLAPMWRARIDSDEAPVCIFDDVNHRAYQYLMFHAADVLSIALLGAPGIEDDLGGCLSTAVKCQGSMRFVDPSDTERHVLYSWMAARCVTELMQAKFYSYRSNSGLVFDSAVHSHHARLMSKYQDDDGFKNFYSALHGKTYADGRAAAAVAMETRDRAWSVGSLRRKLSAAFAVRTRRMEAR